MITSLCFSEEEIKLVTETIESHGQKMEAQLRLMERIKQRNEIVAKYSKTYDLQTPFKAVIETLTHNSLDLEDHVQQISLQLQ